MGQSIGKNVARGDFDSLFEKVMFKNDETSLSRCRIVDDVLPIIKDLLGRSNSTMNVKIYRVVKQLQVRK